MISNQSIAQLGSVYITEQPLDNIEPRFFNPTYGDKDTQTDLYLLDGLLPSMPKYQARLNQFMLNKSSNFGATAAT